MSKKILYLDESGKTGTQRYAKKWNFVNQPYFALCGILISESNVDELNEFVDSIKQSYKIQGEIKATKGGVRKNIDSLMEEFWNKEKELNCELYLEIVNKKFCMAMYITDYCVFPYYDIQYEKYTSYEGTVLRKNFANFIYDSISDELLGEFVEFFDDDIQDVSKMKLLCKKLIQNIKHTKFTEYVNDTLDSIDNHKRLGLLKRHLFPVVDYYKGKCSTVAVCPHINSFNNILNRLEDMKNLNIIHDKLADLEEALRKIVSEQVDKNTSDIMGFEDSRNYNILQLADFWCGNINEVVQGVLNGENNSNSIAKDIIQTKVNFVSTFKEQETLFPNNSEIAQLGIWYRDYFGK